MLSHPNVMLLVKPEVDVSEGHRKKISTANGGCEPGVTGNQPGNGVLSCH